VWCWYYNEPTNDRYATLPYRAQSPSLLKRIEYKTEQDIWDEIGRIMQKEESGSALYKLIPFFANANKVIQPWHNDVINEYMIHDRFNVPIGKNLDDIDAILLDYFIIISNEIEKIKLEEKRNAR